MCVEGFRWWTCMSCFDPDGPGQRSGDRWGKWRDGFLVLATGFPSFWHIYNLAQSVILCFHLCNMFCPAHCLRFTLFLFTFTLLFPKFVTFLRAWVKLFTFVVEWMMISFLRGCGGAIVPCMQTCIAFEKKTYSVTKCLGVASERKPEHFCLGNKFETHKIHCT